MLTLTAGTGGRPLAAAALLHLGRSAASAAAGRLGTGEGPRLGSARRRGCAGAARVRRLPPWEHYGRHATVAALWLSRRLAAGPVPAQVPRPPALQRARQAAPTTTLDSQAWRTQCWRCWHTLGREGRCPTLAPRRPTRTKVRPGLVRCKLVRCKCSLGVLGKQGAGGSRAGRAATGMRARRCSGSSVPGVPQLLWSQAQLPAPAANERRSIRSPLDFLWPYMPSSRRNPRACPGALPAGRPARRCWPFSQAPAESHTDNRFLLPPVMSTAHAAAPATGGCSLVEDEASVEAPPPEFLEAMQASAPLCPPARPRLLPALPLAPTTCSARAADSA